MEKKKATFVVLILLLIIFVPLAIVSTILHFEKTKEGIENPKHEFLYNGKLYFYDNDSLLGTYICENEDYCDFATSKNNSSYALLEYEEEKTNKMSLIKNRYAFLLDTTIANLKDAEIILYDLELNKELGRYKEVKNYGIGIEKDSYLVKNSDEKWGVISFEDGVDLKIPFVYDYIGLIDEKVENQNTIAMNHLVVMQNGKWFLIDLFNTKISDSFTDEIVSYTKNYVILSNGTSMRLLNYEGKDRLFGDYKYLHFCDPYIAIVDNTNTFYLFDLENNKEIGNRHNVKNPKELSYEKTNKHLRVSVAGEIIENIAIS